MHLCKKYRMSFKVSLKKSLIPFTRVFTDVWGPFSSPSVINTLCLLLMIVLR